MVNENSSLFFIDVLQFLVPLGGSNKGLGRVGLYIRGKQPQKLQKPLKSWKNNKSSKFQGARNCNLCFVDLL